MRTGLRPPLVQASPTWRAALMLSVYRVAISFGLVATLSSGNAESVFNPSAIQLFNATCLVYLALGVGLTSTALVRWPRLHFHVFGQITIDIAAIVLLSYAGGGASGGLAMLLLPPLAAAGMLLNVRQAGLLAACATLGLLGQETLRYWRLSDHAVNFVQSGILGSLYFAAAILAYVLARRVRASEASAASHASQARDLAELNRRIIDQMEIGAIVLDADNRLQTINKAALDLLDQHSAPTGPVKLATLSPQLASALAEWRASRRTPEMVDVADLPLLPSFTALGDGKDAFVLLFLEDARRVSAQAQQMKLVSLGQLTAGIAHEIRNPLGAISHAAQLLSESSRLTPEDTHLLDMIHRHCQRIDRIIDDVLGLARRPEQQQCILELGDWLTEAITDYQNSRSDPPSLTLDTAPSNPRVRFDPGQLRRVLFNLWDNSDRHARRSEAGAPTIRLSIGAGPARNLTLDIVDDGPGIDEALLDRIAAPFFTTAADGTGLGLYISRELCQANGARLEVMARPQGAAPGAHFRIWLPRGLSADPVVPV